MTNLFPSLSTRARSLAVKITQQEAFRECFFHKNVLFTLKNAARWIVKTTLISSNIIALRNLQSRNGVQDERFSGGLSLASSFSGKGEDLREKRKEGYLPFMWENRKFRMENQIVRPIPFGKLQKIWAVI